MKHKFEKILKLLKSLKYNESNDDILIAKLLIKKSESIILSNELLYLFENIENQHVPFNSQYKFIIDNITTNNIYQNIGCNTYCERTSENAHKYLEKKLDAYEKKYKIISDDIDKLTKEIQLALELEQTSNINKNNINQDDDDHNSKNVFVRPDGFLEIREEYHSSDEENNKHNVKNEKINSLSSNINEIQEKIIKREDDITNINRNENKKDDERTQHDEKHKIIKNKSLNINKQGLLNIQENYTSSSSEIDD